MSAEKSVGRVGTDTEGVLAALRRARLRAERVALMTGTSLVVVIDGKTVLVPPRTEEAIRAQETTLAGGQPPP
jgi:hypothetical protein